LRQFPFAPLREIISATLGETQKGSYMAATGFIGFVGFIGFIGFAGVGVSLNE
jgi:Na+(H+)/acetate symporter ActP